jgi:hypothetical protein
MATQTTVGSKYGAITVEGVERVVTSLFRFSNEVTARILAATELRCESILYRERADLGRHSKTGAQAASVRTRIKAYGVKPGFGAAAIYGSVIVGGRRDSRQARVFEHGANWTVQVPAHASTSEFGKKFSVAAHAMAFKRPAHEYLTKALNIEGPRYAHDVAVAVGDAAQSTGMTA